MMRMSAALALALTATGVTAGTLSLDGWSVDLPPGCTASIAQVPALPLYDEQARKDFAADPMLSLKPDFENMPAHVRIDLASCYAAEGGFNAALRILPVADYLSIYDPNGKPDPRMREVFADLRSWITKKNGKGEIWPLVPFLDESPMLTYAPSVLKFADGQGVRVVTQFVPDVGFVTSGQITYLFQGLSSDDAHFVLVTVPLTLDGLSKPDATEHLGATLETLDTDKAARKRYVGAAKQLLHSREGDIRPRLAELDAMVQSVRHVKAGGK